ncbi:hypothetical protein F3N42_03720 [Marinihelvus fidelis]|uniref:Uncharacterized protein n=1 Tax=Marinihelvus fidelis TaxID=2613842 RepID=A0A5N0TEQ4_9GAMM|nr:hypothetical protein [Marinihelvus fidelis]KAA9133470.1 hypothetical protein F3N42_03720 [Marinihelvus fidelis]
MNSTAQAIRRRIKERRVIARAIRYQADRLEEPAEILAGYVVAKAVSDLMTDVDHARLRDRVRRAEDVVRATLTVPPGRRNSADIETACHRLRAVRGFVMDQVAQDSAPDWRLAMDTFGLVDGKPTLRTWCALADINFENLVARLQAAELLPPYKCGKAA